MPTEEELASDTTKLVNAIKAMNKQIQAHQQKISNRSTRSFSGKEKDELVDQMKTVFNEAAKIFGEHQPDDFKGLKTQLDSLKNQGAIVPKNFRSFSNAVERLNDNCDPKSSNVMRQALNYNQATFEHNNSTISALEERRDQLINKNQSKRGMLTGYMTKRNDRLNAIEGIIDRCQELQEQNPQKPINLSDVVAELKKMGHGSQAAEVFQVGLQAKSSGLSGGRSEFQKVVDTLDSSYRQLPSPVSTNHSKKLSTSSRGG